MFHRNQLGQPIRLLRLPSKLTRTWSTCGTQFSTVSTKNKTFSFYPTRSHKLNSSNIGSHPIRPWKSTSSIQPRIVINSPGNPFNKQLRSKTIISWDTGKSAKSGPLPKISFSTRINQLKLGFPILSRGWIWTVLLRGTRRNWGARFWRRDRGWCVLCWRIRESVKSSILCSCRGHRWRRRRISSRVRVGFNLKGVWGWE